MVFNTPLFVFTLGAFLMCWYVLPNKIKKTALLLFSYFYAWQLGGIWTVITLAAVTLLTWGWGLLLEKNKGQNPGSDDTLYSPHDTRVRFLTLLFVLILTILLAYSKYTPFLSDLLENRFGIQTLPKTAVSMIGVSYYVFSAISYIVDISRGNDHADRSLFDIALWLSFFPKFIAGPIERHKQFNPQMDHLRWTKFDFERVKRGLLICALGYFYKIIIADRASFFVDFIYADVNVHTGLILFLAMLIYPLQVYFDFAGYSMIAYGISFSIGLKITKNFDHPYFAESLSEFWRRWHISLSTWLKDYIYIPLGGSRKGSIRQAVNLMLTFIISGMWHGVGITYIIWGGIHGFFQLLEKPFRRIIHLPGTFGRGITYLIFSASMIFFRSDSLLTAKCFIRRMLKPGTAGISDGAFLNMGLNRFDWLVLAAGLLIAGVVEVLQVRGISIYRGLQKRNIVIRWCVYYLIIVILVIFGIYGPSYDAANFVYFNF